MIRVAYTVAAPRSIVHALFLIGALALAAVAALPRDALAHGSAHNHGTPAAGSTTSAGNGAPAATQIGAVRDQQPRPHAHAAAPSHCPEGPFGACCCAHLALVHHIVALAGVPGEILVVRPTGDYRPDLHDSGYRSAFFLLAAPPRAPPSPPVTA